MYDALHKATLGDNAGGNPLREATLSRHASFFHAALTCAGWNLYSLRKNPRFWMSLLLGFLLCWLLTDKTMAISRTYLTNVEIFEPFVWCYADSDSVLYAALVMLLMTSAFPRLDAAEAGMIFRTTRARWLLGQIITTFALTLFYCLMILLCSIAMSIGSDVYLDDRWSDTATMLSFAPASFEVALTVIRKTVKLTTPYQSAVQIFILLFQYVLLLSMIQLTFSVLKNRRAGILASLTVNFIGFVLTPERFMVWLNLPTGLQYYANVLSAWVSPLQHATYAMHSFGYDLLPRLSTTHLIFGGITTALMLVSLLAMRRFSFAFSGGNEDEQ